LAAAAVTLAAVLRAAGADGVYASPVGAAAAALVAARFAVTVGDVVKGELPWTRLPFAAGVAGEIVLGVTGAHGGVAVTRALLVALEVGVIAFAAVAAVRAARDRTSTVPPEERITQSVERVVPAAIARFAAFELGILRAALGPAARVPREEGAQRFAYGAESPLRPFLLVYPLLAFGEELVAAVCIPSRFVAVHVVLLAVGVYGFVWLLGVSRSMRARPHAVTADAVAFHRGILAFAVLPRASVVSVRPVEREDIRALPEKPGRLDVGPPRLLVSLRDPVACGGAFGKRAVRSVVVTADDPAGLTKAIAPAG
jgi:hypothetical protein